MIEIHCSAASTAMKKHIYIFTTGLVLLIFLLPSLSYAAFQINLRNGKEIITTYYWQDDDEIKFYYADGTVGIAADTIHSITRTTKSSIGRSTAFIPTPAPAANKPPDQKPAEKPETKQNAPKPAVDEKLLAQYQDEFKMLQKHYEGVEGMSADELIALAKDIIAWRNNVNKAHLGASFSASFAEMVSMLDKIEALHKSKQ